MKDSVVKVKGDIKIKRPVEEVFNFLLIPENFVGVFPGLVSIREISHSPSVKGSSCKFTFQFLTVFLDAKTTITKLRKNKLLQSEVVGEMEGRSKYILDKDSEGITNLHFESEMTLPGFLTILAGSKFIQKIADNRNYEFLKTLKILIEAQGKNIK